MNRLFHPLVNDVDMWIESGTTAPRSLAITAEAPATKERIAVRRLRSSLHGKRRVLARSLATAEGDTLAREP